jgi:hypothetical protein
MFMDVVAIGNFRSVNRLLADPGIQTAELIHNLGHDNSRILLRRLAGEANAWLFEQWEWTQLGTGLCLLLVLIYGNRPPTVAIILCVVMMCIILAQRFALTPTIASLGRVIDFLPPASDLPEKKKFGLYHGVYSTLELVKIAIGFIISGMFLIKRKPDRQFFVRGGEEAEEMGHRRFPK